MLLTKGDKLLFIGDSITDCDRARPIGETGGLGHGYVSYVEALLGAVYPDYRIRVVNTGISGNTVRDLKERWKSDVLDQKPDWLSIMIGTNDVWRQFDQSTRPETHVLPEEYEATLSDLVSRTKPLVKGLVLMTPFYIEPLQTDAMRARMDQYGAIVRSIADQHQTLFVDTQAAFEPVLRHEHSSRIAWDRVHPNNVGHMTLARAFLGAIGFDK